MSDGRGGPAGRSGPADRGGAASWTVPGYTHVRDLGAGRSGRVTLAVDDVTQTPVAIKYLRGAAAPGDRLAADAGPLSRLEDPNLVQFYEYAESPDGGRAVVIEYVEGVSLRRLLARGRGIGPEAALSVLSGSLLALAALHGAGLVHGSYKPENVLIAADGTVKVGDVGVGDAPPYRAPEGETSPAADLYAATTVFVECLAGAHAVPEPFRAIVFAGLAADPERRPASAAAFLTDLDETAAAMFGPSWDRTGRDGLAEQVAAVAADPDPDPRAPDSPPEAAPGPPEPVGDVRGGDPAGTYPHETPAHGTTPFEPAPHDPAPYDSASYEPARHEARPYESARYDPRSYESVAYELGAYGPGEGDEATGHGPRRPPPYSRTGVRIAIGAGVAVILAIGAGWYALSNRGSPDTAAHAQATSSPSPTERTRPPARPGELARAISKAVAARRTATFTYRTAGAAAQGMLKFTAGSATAYDMNLTPLAGAHPDRRHPVSRVILVGDRAYVARGGWRSFPASRVKRAGGQGRFYATLAVDTRDSSSVYNILALLRSSTKVRRTGLTYRGVASLSRLARERAVADLYARAPRGAVVGFTLEMGQNLLPRQLTVSIKAPGGRQRTYRTTYTGWGHGPSIVPPR
ncbi:MAG TPA: protein kinase [Streptosporangiaceae bacterium]|nr:protein kinase [Streptosporangiaceae bacterium]